jgi:hypothetical protein
LIKSATITPRGKLKSKRSTSRPSEKAIKKFAQTMKNAIHGTSRLKSFEKPGYSERKKWWQ